ncbi:uncharacterized protein LOC134815021 isoform X2 [Bolinopsis microptera]|uniref:uncharacterized protein LOC134815021 isoform X2 n=1 Tax=Bolinopsis microptera TaxID=2820187 RepID=UPI00307A29BC
MTITIIILTTLLWSSVKGNWGPVVRGVEIEWDLESTPLEISTNSELGSGDKVRVFFYSADNKYAGTLLLNFLSTVQYELSWCDSPMTPFDNDLPSAIDKVWRITLTRTAGVRLVIHCNEVEVLNILLSETCSDNDWSTYWNRDVAKIKFESTDTASDYYGTKPDDCAEGQFLDQTTGCTDCPADEWSAPANTDPTCTACPTGKGVASGAGTQESDCTFKEDEQGDNQNYSDAAALKVSLIFLVVLPCLL